MPKKINILSLVLLWNTKGEVFVPKITLNGDWSVQTSKRTEKHLQIIINVVYMICVQYLESSELIQVVWVTN